MIFLSGQPNVKEEDLIIVQELFAATVGEKINLESEELLTREIEQFIQLLYQHFSLDFAKYNVDIRQFHILYLIGYLFLDYNKTKINMDNVQFQDNCHAHTLFREVNADIKNKRTWPAMLKDAMSCGSSSQCGLSDS